ncbi:MAG: phosphatidylethanolamine/phosphatidyl-N-methylethanolamine N-methyltransferase [Alphaproteobacteria bacterium]|jgi:phosphatidylethanolamine/phosphatidyl-N-methylethanolamine N-methyltransferase
MDLTAVQKAYARWAPHYDVSFGIISDYGRKNTVDLINQKPGRVLEVGVGTGLSLPLYNKLMSVTGIDLSENMLKRAQNRVKKEQLKNIEVLEKKDATDTGYPDNSFDTAVAMYIMSVAPQPEKILAEMVRTVKPGGDIYILNHFSSDSKRFRFLEKIMSPICRFIGWHSTFSRDRVLQAPELELVEEIRMQPFNLFTLLKFKKIQ